MKIFKKELAKTLNVSKSSLYYKSKLLEKDWRLKTEIEEVLHYHPSYGHKRIALALNINKKRALRVMKIYGIKPYRRRGKKPRKKRDENNISSVYPNLLLKIFPNRLNVAWASDFTYIRYRQRFVYLATIMDLFSREIVGFNVLTAHNTELTRNALFYALGSRPKPKILHSDQGREYTAKDYLKLVENAKIRVSMSRKASPWENGYQESFYSQFKVDLGDPERFEDIGELAYSIYRTVYDYNHGRIHTSLKMPPAIFARQFQ